MSDGSVAVGQIRIRPAAIQRRIIPPPLQRLTRRLTPRTVPRRFSMTFVLERVRSKDAGSPIPIRVSVSPSPSLREAAAPG